MRKSILLGVLGLMALSLIPVSAHAQMPGERCGVDDQVIVGTTRMARDRQNIIACLETGDTTPGANVTEWKAMTSSGGGGVTGGCHFNGDFVQANAMKYYLGQRWGKGCRSSSYPHGSRFGYPSHGVDYSFCAKITENGYECGTISGDQEDNNSWSCACVKK